MAHSVSIHTNHSLIGKILNHIFDSCVHQLVAGGVNPATQKAVRISPVLQQQTTRHRA